MERLIYATSMKGRLGMLMHSLPTWLNLPHDAVLILDWDSPDQNDVADFVDSVQNGKIHLASVRNRATYEHSRCRNVKTGLCRFLANIDDIENRFIFSVDSDIQALRDPMEDIEKLWASRDALYVFGGVDNGWMPHTTGSSVHTFGKFLMAGGCDENMQGWGREDLKFFEAMTKVGVKLQLPGDIIHHIPHDDRMRTKYCAEKNKWASNARNGYLLGKKSAVYRRDFDIELRYPDKGVRIITPDDDLYMGKIKEMA